MITHDPCGAPEGNVPEGHGPEGNGPEGYRPIVYLSRRRGRAIAREITLSLLRFYSGGSELSKNRWKKKGTFQVNYSDDKGATRSSRPFTVQDLEGHIDATGSLDC